MPTQEVITPPPGMGNAEFLTRYGRPGLVGLAGGTTLIDRAITRAERHVDAGKRPGRWSHAFLLGERRTDGFIWVIESDLEIHRRHIRLGVQENRIEKYFAESSYWRLALLDFNLPPPALSRLLSSGLEMVAHRTRYSLRELVGTLLALRRDKRVGHDNKLARDRCIYCSALVQHLFRKVGLDLAPGLDDKHTTPEDLARSPVPHTLYLLEHPSAPRRLARIAHRVRSRVRLARRKAT
jgi:hypothetical protein